MKEIHDEWLLMEIDEAKKRINSKCNTVHTAKLLENAGFPSFYSFIGMLRGITPDAIIDDEEKIIDFFKNTATIDDLFSAFSGFGDKTIELIKELAAGMAYQITVDERRATRDMAIIDIPEKCPIADENMCYYAVRCGEEPFFSIEEKSKYSIQRWDVKEGEFYTLKMSRNWYDKEVVGMRIKLFCQFGAKMFKVQKEVK